MKNYFCLLFWLLVLIYSASGQTKVGNPDETARIERPCPSLDLNCIRLYFEKHAKCKKTKGPIPDPLIRPHAIFYYPRVNLTATTYYLNSTGVVNGRVEEFYINRDTDKLVIAVEFRRLNLTTNSIYFRFHRRAKEPIVTKAFATVEYDSVITTAVIPQIDKLQLDKAVCTTFANDAVPRLFIGPSAFESGDPQVQRTMTEFLADIPTDTQEFFLTQSSYYIVSYIQYNICDFGLKVT